MALTKELMMDLPKAYDSAEMKALPARQMADVTFDQEEKALY